MQTSSEILKGFAVRLRDARVARGFASAAALAEAAGVEHERIRKWEQGANFPRIPDLYRVCTLLGATADWLLFGNPAGLSTEGYSLFVHRAAR